MIKHRQDGFVGLHGAILLLIISGAFIGMLALVETRGWIQFNIEVNWGLYLVGVVVAMAWNRHSLGGMGGRLGMLTLAEAARLSVQQTMRLMVFLFALTFVTKDVEMSRLFLMGFLAVAGALLLTANYFLAPVLAGVFFRNRRLRTIIVAPTQEAQQMQAWLLPRVRHIGIEPIGYVTPEPAAENDNGLRLGSISDLMDIVLAHGADQVVFAQMASKGEGVPEIIRAIEGANCRVHYYVNMDTIFGGIGRPLEHNDHYAFVASTAEPLENPFNRMLKRLFDIAVSLPVVVLILPPLTLLVWVMQRLQSPGPVFYSQLRAGLNCERFRIYKFRTMHAGDDRDRARQATVNDPRVYRFGQFLRRSSLDEMPQFVNVLLGVMSVSGPRPHLLEHDEKFARLEHAYFKRHFVKPGITGLAQSMGFRGEMVASSDLTNRVHYDEFYVANWSLRLDLSILLKTISQVLRPPNSAY